MTATSRPSIARDALWVGAGVAVATASGFASNLVIPRLMPIDQAGAFFIVVSATTLIPFLFRLGLDRSAVRQLGVASAAQDRAAVLDTVVAYLRMSLWITVVPAGILWLGVWQVLACHVFDSRLLASVAPQVSLLVAFESSRLILSECLRGLGRQFMATWLGNAGRAFVYFVLLLAVGFFQRDRFDWALWMAVAASVTTCVAAAVALVREAGPTGLRSIVTRGGGRVPAKSMVATAWPFYVTSIWSFASNQGDVLIAGATLPQSQAATYAAVSKFSLVLALPAVALSQLIGPMVPRYWETGQRGALEPRVRALTTLFGIPTIGAALALMIGSRLVVDVALPAGYDAASGVLAILAAAPLVTALTGPNGYVLMMAGQARVVGRAATAVSVAQLAAMIVLANTAGIIGLALASTAGTVMLNLFCSMLVRRNLGLATEIYVRPRDWVASALVVKKIATSRIRSRT